MAVLEESVARTKGGDWGPVMVCLGAVLGLGLLLRTQHISDLTMHFDECCSWKISQFPWDEMLDAVSRDAHPPVYYMLLHGLGRLGINRPETIRGVSVFFGLATILAAFWFVRTALLKNEGVDRFGATQGRERSLDRNVAAVLASVLVGGSALHVEMSLQARPYTLGTFLTLVSATYLLRCLPPVGVLKKGIGSESAETFPEDSSNSPPHRSFANGGSVVDGADAVFGQARWKPAPRLSDWIGFAVTATLLSLTHYYCLFAVAAEFLFAVAVLAVGFWRTGWNSTTKRTLTGLVLSAWGLQIVWSFWLPVFLFQRERSTPQLWMAPLDWNGLSANMWMALAGGQTSSVPAEWSWLAVATWGATVAALLIFGTRGGRLAALCAGFPLVATVVYCLAVRNILGVKYLIFGQVFFLVGMPLLLARIRWRILQGIVAAGLLAWSGYWCWQHAEFREHQASFAGVRGATAYLECRRTPGEPVVVGSPFVSIVVQKYAGHPDGIYVQDRGDHRRDMLWGPPLRDEEYRDVESHFSSNVTRAWAVDVFELFGPQSRFEARLPGEWTLVSQKEFREAYGMPCVLAVREYQRRPNDE